GNRDDVVFGEIGDDSVHQRRCLPRARAVSHIEQLPRDIQRLQAREPRNFAQAFQPFAVTDCALHRLPGRSAFDQRFASGDAARWHVRDETGMRVPDFRAERVRGDLKDTTSDRLGASVGMELTITDRGAAGCSSGNQSGGVAFPAIVAASYSFALPGAFTMPSGRTAVG